MEKFPPQDFEEEVDPVGRVLSIFGGYADRPQAAEEQHSEQDSQQPEPTQEAS